MIGTAQPVAILDAVCCVQFCAAGKDGLLLALLIRLNWEIQVPGEVDIEVRGNARKYPDLTTRWKRLTANDRVMILPALDATDPSSSDELQREVLHKVASLRGAPAARALAQKQDLGEYVVVGYGSVLTRRGREVVLLLDDLAGQELAAQEDLDVIDMEQLLLLGHRLGVVGLTTKTNVRTVYDQLRPFGGSLGPWAVSRLKCEL